MYLTLFVFYFSPDVHRNNHGRGDPSGDNFSYDFTELVEIKMEQDMINLLYPKAVKYPNRAITLVYFV